MRLYPQVPLPPEAVEQWNSFLMPQINLALRHFYHKHPESVEISLESIGESPRETRPTVLVVCTSVAKVRAILKRKLGSIFDGTTGFSLKVCRGQVLRSRKNCVPRSMARGGQGTRPENEIVAANGDFQERPLNGASIGAWIGDRHLPPVSFGGLVMIDDRPYGMTVHHMLDDPDADQTVTTAGPGGDILRSSAAAQEIEDLTRSLADWYAELQVDSSDASSSGDDFACEFSDAASDGLSESDITSEASDSEEEDEEEGRGGEPGDIPGIDPGYGDGYVVTQPALDDVEEGFYPDAETEDDDHLDSYGLGEVYASSGIRRRSDENGLIHEIDWALFEFKNERLPDKNSIPRAVQDTVVGSNSGKSTASPGLLYPTTVAPASALPGLEVQCIARTSGLQMGLILPTLTSVKIYGRTSASHTYQVSGSPYKKAQHGSDSKPRPPLPIGIPGDSGAWVVERVHGRLCGHVLAWSGRKKVAYICPMDVLLLDIAETLGADEVRLPGGEAVVKIMDDDERGGPLDKGRGKESEGQGQGLERGRSAADKGQPEEEDLAEFLEEEDDADVPAALRPGPPGQKAGLKAGQSAASRGYPKHVGEPKISGDLAKLHIGSKGVQTPC